MKTVQESTEFPTFASLLLESERNEELVRAVNYYVQLRGHKMRKNIRAMENAVRKLDESTTCTTCATCSTCSMAVDDSDEPKAA